MKRAGLGTKAKVGVNLAGTAAIGAATNLPDARALALTLWNLCSPLAADAYQAPWRAIAEEITARLTKLLEPPAVAAAVQGAIPQPADYARVATALARLAPAVQRVMAEIRGLAQAAGAVAPSTRTVRPKANPDEKAVVGEAPRAIERVLPGVPMVYDFAV